MNKSILSISTLITALLLNGCEKPQITVTQVPKTQKPESAGSDHTSAPMAEAQMPSSPPPTQGMTMLPGMREQAEALPDPTWEAPTHWQAQSGSAMRKGSWLVINNQGVTADMSVLAFPGDVGGDLANINRWLGQIQASPIDTETMEQWKQSGKRDVGGFPGYTVFLEGKEQATYGAIVRVHTHTWFFKLTGDKNLVETERTSVDQLLDTVEFPTDT